MNLLSTIGTLFTLIALTFSTSSIAPNSGSSPGGFNLFLPNMSVGVDAHRTQRVSIIERALALVNYENIAVAGETTDVYAGYFDVDDLETWLRDGAIVQTAEIQGRPVDEVREEWDSAGITFLGPSILNTFDHVWFIDARGGISFLPVPIIPPPGGDPPTYDNMQQVLDSAGNSLSIGAFSDTSYWTPPAGELVPPERWGDEEYLIELP